MWHHLRTYLSIFSILYLIYIIECQETLVKISQGILRGKPTTNRDGGTFYSFQNIPYAQPPIDDLRFKAPVAADGWDGIRDATTDVPICLQYGNTETPYIGQEDCLYLSVYTPELSGVDSGRRPVMVFIHGGGFTSGSAQTTVYGPEFLLTKDIVLVTINYRLGIFGFLNLNDPELEVPGNAGMKDQVLALKWVKDNVEQFGGDPNDITIFGQSAGSISVHLHILSSMSTGLFHKAIAQSGVALLSILKGTGNNGEVIAEQLGIETGNLRAMLESLRDASAEKLIMATQIILADNEQFIAPIIEEPSNEQSFWSNEPIDIIRSGNYNHVPFLTGTNNVEGLTFQMVSLQNTGQDLLIENFSYFVPREFGIAPGSEKEAAVIQKIKEFYYGDTEPSREDIVPAVELYTDFLFSFPAYRSVLEHLPTLSAPMYLYIFSADTVLNLLKQIDPRIQEFPGAGHSDELGYLFTNVFTPSAVEDGSVEDLSWRNMVNLWTNFAIYGNPTPDDSNGFVWQPVNDDVFNFVHISTNVTYADVDPNPISIKFWSDLFEEYCPIN